MSFYVYLLIGIRHRTEGTYVGDPVSRELQLQLEFYEVRIPSGGGASTPPPWFLLGEGAKVGSAASKIEPQPPNSSFKIRSKS